MFIVICRSRDLPEGHGVTVPKDSVVVLYVFWEGYSNQTVNNFIKQTKAGISPSLIQCAPS